MKLDESESALRLCDGRIRGYSDTLLYDDGPSGSVEAGHAKSK